MHDFVERSFHLRMEHKMEHKKYLIYLKQLFNIFV